MATKKQTVNVKKVTAPAAKAKQMKLKETQSIAPLFTVQSLVSMMQERLVIAAS